jgi:hypothetical protein
MINEHIRDVAASASEYMAPGTARRRVLMKELFYILAFGVVLGVIHLIFRNKEKESLEEFEEAEKEFEEKAHKRDLAEA